MRSNYADNPKVGALVYRKGAPHLPGKVLGAKPADALGCHQIHVLWLSGEESQISDNLLRDYSALIKAQEDVLAKYREVRKKMEAM